MASYILLLIVTTALQVSSYFWHPLMIDLLPKMILGEVALLDSQLIVDGSPVSQSPIAVKLIGLSHFAAVDDSRRAV